VTTVPTGCIGQPGLVERRHLNHVNQLNLLHQQLSNTVAAVHDDRHSRVEIDQRHLDLAAISSVDGARAVDDRKPNPRSQSRPRMHQPDHSERDGDREPGPHQGTASGREFDVFGTVEIDAGVTVVGAVGQRQPGVETNNRQTGRHGAKDYP